MRSKPSTEPSQFLVGADRWASSSRGCVGRKAYCRSNIGRGESANVLEIGKECRRRQDRWVVLRRRERLVATARDSIPPDRDESLYSFWQLTGSCSPKEKRRAGVLCHCANSANTAHPPDQSIPGFLCCSRPIPSITVLRILSVRSCWRIPLFDTSLHMHAQNDAFLSGQTA